MIKNLKLATNMASGIFPIWKIFVLLCILISQQGYSQTSYPKDYFRAPMDIDMLLAGNFAELRTNHFHTGLDIKTNGKEGYRLYSVADGYISRINVSHWGYGLCVYVRHPNGYTSVYAHCSRFTDEVEAFVKKAQRKKETETITLYPGKEQFPLKKGDVVAYSGNSGSSTAPHLHFEIRDTKTEEPINPLLFGFNIKDDIPPSVFDLKVYSFKGANISGTNRDRTFDVIKSGGVYKITGNKIIEAHGKIGFAINTIDRLNAAPNKCGVYTIDLYHNDEVIYQQKLERLSFYTNRYINAHMDYLEYRYGKESFHKSFRVENNKLPIYGTVVNDGFVEIRDNEVHHFKYLIKDVYGNESTLQFAVKGNPQLAIKQSGEPKDHQFDASDKNQIVTDNFKAYLPKGAMYEDANVKFKEAPPHTRSVGPVYDFHTDSVPLQKYFILKLKLSAVKPEHQNKALIAELSNNRHQIWARGGSYEDGWVSGKVRSFGNYTVVLDTTPPVITPTNISGGKYKSARKLSFKISDDLSGIESYQVYLNGTFYHSYYTPRTQSLEVPFDKYNPVESGDHKLKVVVTDERGNESVYTADITM